MELLLKPNVFKTTSKNPSFRESKAFSISTVAK